MYSPISLVTQSSIAPFLGGVRWCTLDGFLGGWPHTISIVGEPVPGGMGVLREFLISSVLWEGGSYFPPVPGGPVPYPSNLRIIRHAPFVVAFVTEDNNFRYCDEKLLGQDGGASAAELMENSVDVVEMLPDKLTYPSIFRNNFVTAFFGFKM